MSTDSHKPSREELLEELESIRKSLLPEFGNAGSRGENGEPTAQRETITATVVSPVNTESPMSDEEQSLLKAYEQDSPMSVLPGQQSLFDDSIAGEEQNITKEREPVLNPPSTPESEAPSQAMTNDNSENPFLPKHMKERLEKEKSLYQQEIHATSKITGTKLPGSEEEDQALINELVELYLPKIEEELRQRLEARLKGEIASLTEEKTKGDNEEK